MTDLEYKHMGVRLADVREQRGCSLHTLSDLTELHYNTLRAIEHGTRKPSLDTLVCIVRALDVSMDYIVLGVRPQANSWGLVLRSDDELDAVIAANPTD